MRIALLTSGRFSLLDLGRELSALGHDVLFYSLVPPTRARTFGLPAQCDRWLARSVWPAYLASRVARRGLLGEQAAHALLMSIDRAAARQLERCDVLVAMSGIGVRALDTARRRWGAKVFLERSSRHILSQRAILEATPGAVGPVPFHAVNRELTGYGLADYISVPARHVAESFIEYGVAEEKLFVNCFGVDLEMFPATAAPAEGVPATILMVGAWSVRKGVDVLVEAWRQLPGTRLVHVGPVTDAPLPTDPLFEHVDPVDQSRLTKYYAMAHVLALASREEGQAYVQLQALASGLRVVCTTRTGGEDLKSWVNDPRGLVVAPTDDAAAFGEALRVALDALPEPGSLRDVLGPYRQQLSWRMYAKRYERKMKEALRIADASSATVSLVPSPNPPSS